MRSTSLQWTKIAGIAAFAILSLQANFASAVGFPTNFCRPGYIPVGPRLCISQFVQSANYFDDAIVNCRNQRGRVATYGDLYYLYRNTGLDASYNPNGKWIGEDLISDDNALCGNRDITFNGDGDQYNFEGTCHKLNVRAYWCAHDRE